MSLKEKTIAGLTWSFIDLFAKQGITFVIGIVLARLLTPSEFGLIGMTTIFVVISQSFIDSGFGQALVRKNRCTQTDYSTVFFYNLFIGILFYFILFFSAEAIANFFKEPQLRLIIQVLGIGVVIKSITIIHQIILIKEIDFKLQTRISLIASIGSGMIGIFMAIKGYGVWSLVVKSLSSFALTSLFLWIWNSWKPSLIFSSRSFKDLFSFGSKLLISGLIKRIYENILLLVIGKYFSAADLGYFTRANQFQNLSSRNITAGVQRVSYPALSTIQDDRKRLKSSYRRLIKSTMLLTLFLMIGLIVLAKPLIIVLIGYKWLPSVIYLQLLSIVGIFHPLQEINQNMLKVKGRSDIILKLEIVKKILIVPVIVVGVLLGVKILIIGMILTAMFSYIADSHYAGKQIKYRYVEQLKDILPSVLLGCFSGGIVSQTDLFISASDVAELAIKGSVYCLLFLGICELAKLPEYIFIKDIISVKLSARKRKV